MPTLPLRNSILSCHSGWRRVSWWRRVAGDGRGRERSSRGLEMRAYPKISDDSFAVALNKAWSALYDTTEAPQTAPIQAQTVAPDPGNQLVEVLLSLIRSAGLPIPEQYSPEIVLSAYALIIALVVGVVTGVSTAVPAVLASEQEDEWSSSPESAKDGRGGYVSAASWGSGAVGMSKLQRREYQPGTAAGRTTPTSTRGRSTPTSTRGRASPTSSGFGRGSPAPRAAFDLTTSTSGDASGTGPTALLSRGASAEDVIRIESRKRAAETRQTARRRVEGRLEALVRSLGSVAVLPGDEEERAEIDSLLRELERLAPIRRPLGGSRGGDGLAYDWKRSGELEGVARGSRQEAPRKELEGVWRLVYASNGTYVTRSPPVQMLCYMSSLPFGFGVQEIQQHLRVDEARGIVHACNLALISLGPLGLWKLGIEGTWEPREDGIVADVRFSRAAIRPVSFWGFTVDGRQTALAMGPGEGRGSAPGLGGVALPQLEVPIPEEQAVTEWQTTFLGERYRVGRGQSANVFLFERLGMDATDHL